MFGAPPTKESFKSMSSEGFAPSLVFTRDAKNRKIMLQIGSVCVRRRIETASIEGINRQQALSGRSN